MDTLLSKFTNKKGVLDAFHTLIGPNEAFESAKQEKIRNIALNGSYGATQNGGYLFAS